MNPVEEFLLIKEAQENKEAGFLSALGNAFRGGEKSLSGAMGHALGQALPGALITASMGAAAYGITKGVGAIREHYGKQRDYQAMLEAAPSLKQRPARQVQMMYNSLRKMAPDMASDPLIAASFVDNSLDLKGNRAAIDPSTVKMLADTQRSLSQGQGANFLMDALQPKYFPKHELEAGPEFSMGPRGLQGSRMTREQAMQMAQEYGMPPQGMGTLRTEYEPDAAGDPLRTKSLSSTKPF